MWEQGMLLKEKTHHRDAGGGHRIRRWVFSRSGHEIEFGLFRVLQPARQREWSSSTSDGPNSTVILG